MIEIIPIVKKLPKKKKKPYYKLVFNYMIGDSEGDTTEETEIELDNPYVERFVSLLNSLKPVEGSWGVQLTNSDLEKAADELQITQDDLHFLQAILSEEESEEREKFNIPEENVDHADSLSSPCRSENEYSFLVFEGIDMYYYDEYGVKFNTRIVKKARKKK